MNSVSSPHWQRFESAVFLISFADADTLTSSAPGRRLARLTLLPLSRSLRTLESFFERSSVPVLRSRKNNSLFFRERSINLLTQLSRALRTAALRSGLGLTSGEAHGDAHFAVGI